MAQKVDLQERLKMRFLAVDYRDKQEVYGTSDTASDTGTIALEILNIPDYVLEDLLKLTDPMMQLVDYLNHNKNPDNSTLAMMLTASRNVFRVVDLLRDVPPFAGQDFTWLDGKLPSIFSADAVKKAYRQRKKEMGEVFIPSLCLVAQLGFGIRDFRKALIPLVEVLDDEEVSRNPAGFAKQFDAFFSEDKHRDDAWMSITNVSMEYLPGEKGLTRRMHYASFPSMFRSNLYEALAVGNAPKRCPTLLHLCCLQLVIEGSVGVLKTSVTVKQRLCIRIGRNRCVQSIKNQSIIVAVADNKRNNPSVV